MKKALLPAIISALCATSVQAANLYDADGTSVNISGSVDAFFTTNNSDNDNGTLNSAAKVQFDIASEVSDSLTTLASFEVEGSNGESVVVDDAWLGFATDFGTVKFGESGSSYAVLEKTELANELSENDVAYDDSGDSFGRAVRYEKAVGPVALSANYSFAEGDVADDDFALSADYAAGDFTIATAYFNGAYEGNDVASMGISTSVEIDALYAAATYTDNDVDDADDFTTLAFSASYAFAPATVYGSFQTRDFDANTADFDYWYAGVSSDLTANVTTFVEYAEKDTDGAEDESELIAGIYYAF